MVIQKWGEALHIDFLLYNVETVHFLEILVKSREGELRPINRDRKASILGDNLEPGAAKRLLEADLNLADLQKQFPVEPRDVPCTQDLSTSVGARTDKSSPRSNLW